MKHYIHAITYDKHGTPISSAYNSYKKSHPLQAYFAKKVGHPNRIYLHAEIAAIIKAGTQKIHTLIVHRGEKNHYLMAKPCLICQEAIKAFGIKNIYYTNVYRDWETDRKSTRLNSSHSAKSRMPSSA